MRTPFALLLLIAALSPPPAIAADSYDGCKYEVTTLPAVLSSQGTWCLKGDLATALASGAAITIAANNVTLDCNRFKVGGLAAGIGTATAGVQFTGRVNVTVRNCNIRGFRWGLHGADSGNATIESNIFEFNTVLGIYLAGGSGTIVRGNRISDTGGSMLFNPLTAGMRIENDMDVVDNIVAGVVPDMATVNQPVFGIYTTGASGTITGNRVRDVHADGAVYSIGIYNASSGRIAIDHNFVTIDGEADAIGVRCGTPDGISTDNRLLGTSIGVLNCTSVGDVVDVD